MDSKNDASKKNGINNNNNDNDNNNNNNNIVNATLGPSRFSEPLSLDDFHIKQFNVSTLRIGGLVSNRDMKKQPKEDHLVVFSSFQFVGPQSGQSVEKSSFAIVRHATCKTVKDGIAQIQGKGEIGNYVVERCGDFIYYLGQKYICKMTIISLIQSMIQEQYRNRIYMYF